MEAAGNGAGGEMGTVTCAGSVEKSSGSESSSRLPRGEDLLDGWPANEAPESTAARSRALTTALGISRAVLDFDGQWGGKGQKSFCIHVVGADFVEANERATQVFIELASWLHRHRGVHHLEIVLVGPNVPLALDGRTIESQGAISIRVRMITGTYEEMLDRFDDNKHAQVQQAALAVLFNAGIWGYDSWAVTLRTLCSRGLPTIVTSYNKWEADDDHDSIEEALEGHAMRWCWVPEVNPYGSHVHRPSGVGDRTCADNAYWQCFQGTPRAGAAAATTATATAARTTDPL